MGRVGGNVASYLCTPEGEVIHAIAGNASAGEVLQQLEFGVELAGSTSGAEASVRRELIRAAQTARAQAGARPSWHPATWLSQRVSQVLAKRPLAPLETVYPDIWEGVLQEYVTDLPVQIVRQGCRTYQSAIRVAYRHGAHRGTAGEALHDALLLHALDHIDEADPDEIERRVAERFSDGAFVDRCFALARKNRETEISRLIAARLEDPDFRAETLARSGPPLAAVVDFLLETDEGRHDLARRLVEDSSFRDRSRPYLRREEQLEIARLLVAGLAADPGEDGGEDGRVGALVAFDAAAVADAIEAELDRALRDDGVPRDPELLGRLTDVFDRVAVAMGPDGVERLLRSRGLLAVLTSTDVAPESVESVIGTLLAALESAPAGRLDDVGDRLRDLEPALRAEVAREVEGVLLRTSGSRRRRVFRLFAELSDERGVRMLVEALRWDGGRLLPDAVAALKRLTGLPFAKPARSRRARAAQIIKIEWWWAEKGRGEIGLD